MQSTPLPTLACLDVCKRRTPNRAGEYRTAGDRRGRPRRGSSAESAGVFRGHPPPKLGTSLPPGHPLPNLLPRNPALRSLRRPVWRSAECNDGSLCRQRIRCGHQCGARALRPLLHDRGSGSRWVPSRLGDQAKQAGSGRARGSGGGNRRASYFPRNSRRP